MTTWLKTVMREQLLYDNCNVAKKSRWCWNYPRARRETLGASHWLVISLYTNKQTLSIAKLGKRNNCECYSRVALNYVALFPNWNANSCQVWSGFQSDCIERKRDGRRELERGGWNEGAGRTACKTATLKTNVCKVNHNHVPMTSFAPPVDILRLFSELDTELAELFLKEQVNYHFGFFYNCFCHSHLVQLFIVIILFKTVILQIQQHLLWKTHLCIKIEWEFLVNYISGGYNSNTSH